MAPQLQKWLVGLSHMKSTQKWARPLNSMTKCSFIQPQLLPSGVRLASFCMHTRNLSEKEIAAAQKSVSDSNRLSQRWRVGRQRENLESVVLYSNVLCGLRNVRWLVACLHAGPLMVWAPLEQWWWAVWRWEKWRRPTSTTSARRKHRTRYKNSRAERQSRSLPGSSEAWC